MVGLVIVSHSRELANALTNLVKQVSSSNIPIAIAAGVGEDRKEFGTDALEISEAIQSVFSPSGVLVMMDLGSAVLSSKLALDFLPPEMQSQIRFCAAPLVEGTIAAAVQISLGSDIEMVCREAEGGLLPKQEQINETPPAQPVEAVSVPDETAQQFVLTLHNLHGLHARPAARFVQTASRFQADIRVTNLTNGKGPASARSLNAIAILGAVENHQIQIKATGPEAGSALTALKKLVDDNFGESTAPEAVSAAEKVSQPEARFAESGSIRAVPISEGFALGPLYRYQAQPPSVSTEPAKSPEVEAQRLDRALDAVRNIIRRQSEQLKTTAGESDAAIFDAHLLILQDPDLLAQARQNIFDRHQNAGLAWHEAAERVVASYRELEDAYIKLRAADVEDVENQVLFALEGKNTAPIMFKEPVVLFAQDLTPTETAQLDMNAVLGIMTVGGGPTSHSAILARALGIPAVSSVSQEFARAPLGSMVALDGFNGTVWLDPSEKIQADVKTRREQWIAARRKLMEASHTPAVTRDGHRVEVFANVGNIQDARNAIKNGAEGIGLLRTEFMFLTRETPPNEAEQLDALLQIGEAMGDCPMIVRTLDVGGDKQVPYIKLPPEPNPFLGVRAIRMSLRNTDLFLQQLRAILRAAANHRFRIMFPMIANVDEVRQARQWLEKAHQQLVDEKISHAWPIETGIMVEIPSAALLSRKLAREVDFFSIGTNDLTQYTLAAERGNPLLADLADAFHPAVLRLIDEVVQAAHAEGKRVGVCGELGGDPLAAPVLIGLGVDELSLNAGGIPRMKSIVLMVELPKARKLAEEVLQTESATEARKLAGSFLER
jgi:multiphosphoryl transfer protein